MNALSTTTAPEPPAARPARTSRPSSGRQQATWSSGDYHMIGTQIQIVSELLLEALDVHSTERVLDVATGSGNAALAAARRGCKVVGIDYVRRSSTAPAAAATPRASTPSSSRATPRPSRSPTPVRRRAARSSGRCSPRTRSRPRASSPASPAPAAGSALPRGRRRASSASSSRPTAARPAARRRPSRSVGHDRAARRAVRRRRRGDPHRAPLLHVTGPLAPGLDRGLPPLVRPDAKSFEAVGEAGARGARADILKLIAASTRRRRHPRRPERVPRGGHRQGAEPLDRRDHDLRVRDAGAGGRSMPRGRRDLRSIAGIFSTERPGPPRPAPRTDLAKYSVIRAIRPSRIAPPIPT